MSRDETKWQRLCYIIIQCQAFSGSLTNYMCQILGWRLQSCHQDSLFGPTFDMHNAHNLSLTHVCKFKAALCHHMVPSVSPWTDEQAQRKKHKRSHCSDAPRKNLHSSRERDQLLRSDSGHLTHPDCWAFVFLCCFTAVELDCVIFFFYWFSLLHRPCRPLWSRTLTFLRALRDKITTSPFSTFLLGPHRGRTRRQPPPGPRQPDSGRSGWKLSNTERVSWSRLLITNSWQC